MNFLEKLRRLAWTRDTNGKARGLKGREVRAFINGDSRLMSANELRSIDAELSGNSSNEERLRAQARALLAMQK